MQSVRVSLFVTGIILVLASGSGQAQGDSFPFYRLSGIDRWEGITATRGNGGYLSYSYSQSKVTDSSVVDGITFYYNTGFGRIGFDYEANKQYILSNGSKLLDLDFTVPPGQTYPNGMGQNVLVTVSGNSISRAFSCCYGFWPTNDLKETYNRDYGLIRNNVIMTMSGDWTEFTTNTVSVLRTLLNGEILYVPHGYTPGLSFSPVPSPANSNKVYFDVRASHSLNSFLTQYSPSFNYLDTLTLEYYYLRGNDSTGLFRHKIKAMALNQFNYLFDTSYVKNGYLLKYRLILSDKSIIPKIVFHSTDQSYSTLAFNFTTGIEDETIPDSYLQLSAYPNPFNSSTTLSLDHPESGDLVIDLYSSSGEKVAEPLRLAKAPGSQIIPLVFMSEPSGIYIADVKFVSSSGKIERKQQKLLCLK